MTVLVQVPKRFLAGWDRTGKREKRRENRKFDAGVPLLE